MARDEELRQVHETICEALRNFDVIRSDVSPPSRSAQARERFAHLLDLCRYRDWRRVV
jgi:hypothetical protein